MLELVIAGEDAQGDESAVRKTLDELARKGALRMIAEELLAEWTSSSASPSIAAMAAACD